MAICRACSRENPDNVNFCSGCGARIDGASAETQNNAYDFEQEQKCLDTIVRMTKYQSVAYRISAIVLTVFAAIYNLIFFGIGLTFIFIGETELVALSLVYFMIVLFYTIAMLPILIFNFVMANKTASYYKNAYQDCTLAVNHLGHVGSIVIAALFNTIALVFEIIGFVEVKTNKDVIERIKMRQGVSNHQDK